MPPTTANAQNHRTPAMPSKPKRCSASRTSTATTTTAATALKIISANGPVATSKRGNRDDPNRTSSPRATPRAPFSRDSMPDRRQTRPPR